MMMIDLLVISIFFVAIILLIAWTKLTLWDWLKERGLG